MTLRTVEGKAIQMHNRTYPLIDILRHRKASVWIPIKVLFNPLMRIIHRVQCSLTELIGLRHYLWIDHHNRQKSHRYHDHTLLHADHLGLRPPSPAPMVAGGIGYPSLLVFPSVSPLSKLFRPLRFLESD